MQVILLAELASLKNIKGMKKYEKNHNYLFCQQ